MLSRAAGRERYRINWSSEEFTGATMVFNNRHTSATTIYSHSPIFSCLQLTANNIDNHFKSAAFIQLPLTKILHLIIPRLTGVTLLASSRDCGKQGIRQHTTTDSHYRAPLSLQRL